MEEKLTAAANLAKEAAVLTEDDGIISVNASFGCGEVHLTEKRFHELFNEWNTEPREDELVYHIHNIGGVRVFCLVQKEETE